MERVGVGYRAVAVLIDSILLLLLGYFIAAGFGQTTEAGFNLRGAPFFVWLALALGYYIVLEKAWGATLGKKAVKLRVVREDGAALDWQAAIVRNVLRLVDGLFLYLVGAVMVWLSKGRQRLGDMAAHTIVVRAASLFPVTMAAALVALAAGEAHAATPKYSEIVLSDSKEGAAKRTFHKDTPQVFLRSRVVDAPAGTKVKAEWIAVKTRAAPPNYNIDSYEMTLAANMRNVTFSLTRPNAGWPEGDYRVDLFIDGKPAGNVPFSVARPAR